MVSVGALALVMLAPTTLELKDSEIARLPERLQAIAARPLLVRLTGRVELASPIVLGREASGVTFTGNATLSGGVVLPQWRREGERYVAGLPFRPRSVRQLFVGNARWRRPTLPAGKDWFRFAEFATPVDRAAPWNQGQTAMVVAQGTLDPAWTQRGELEIVAHHFWVTSRLRIKDWDLASGVVTFDRRSVFKLADDGWGADAKAATFRVENVQEALNQPNSFVWNRARNRIETLTPIRRAIVPRIPEVLRIEGAKDVVIQGLTFAHTEWDLPADSAGDVQAAHTVPASVTVKDSKNVRFEGCRFTQLGTWGIELLGVTNGVEIAASTFDDLGAGGVKVGHETANTLVRDNRITRGGRLFPSACGIWGGLSGGNRVVHNLVRDFYYTGISWGWDWGFRDTAARNNIIAHNDISLIGQGELSDMGGIYVLGKQPGSVIEGNRIRTVDARGYGGWGIYLDEGSTGWTVRNNLVADTKTGGFHIHYGGNNEIANNVFVGARHDAQLIRVRDDQQGPIVFRNNVVVSLDANVPIVGPGWLKRDVTMTGNVFWTPSRDRTMPFGADATNRFEDPKLDRGGLPTIAGWSGFDPKRVGPRP